MSALPPAHPDGVRLVTLGCRLNLHESEAMAHLARMEGHRDVTIVNTCAVTAEAVAQGRQAIRRAHRERPDAPVIVTGCAAQIDAPAFAAMPEVGVLIGNGDKLKPQTWRRLAGSNSLQGLAGPSAEIADIMAATEAVIAPVAPLAAHTRAFLQVQNGCDHRCTFCVIPFGRGRSRSAPIAAVLDQVQRLVDQGAREIVLTGVDLTSYGADLPAAPRLGDLVRAILKEAPSLPRLRLSSIDAVECDAALKAAFAEEARLMPHLHLSLQHGDDLILKRMKRRHVRADAVAFCDEMRALRPDMAFGADLIAGFPTEDEPMFARSLSLIEACGLSQAHVFPYSARPDTPAAKMPQLPPAIVNERAARLRRAAAEAAAARRRSRVGGVERVLAERGARGHGEAFDRVALPPDAQPGEIVSVRIVAEDSKQLIAEGAGSSA
jgi:threonylcarbamoyladenosine tRNA methylthiotransferase MtaB